MEFTAMDFQEFKEDRARVIINNVSMSMMPYGAKPLKRGRIEVTLNRANLTYVKGVTYESFIEKIRVMVDRNTGKDVMAKRVAEMLTDARVDILDNLTEGEFLLYYKTGKSLDDIMVGRVVTIEDGYLEIDESKPYFANIEKYKLEDIRLVKIYNGIYDHSGSDIRFW